ncbi:MAG TPA: type II secretion system protein [Ideonella sp.]|nr:type II secretion system protein [Ideonella sp.]
MRSRQPGFTLVELAVVLTIVALLLGSLLYTLSAQTEQRNYDETRRRLEQARELVLSYAIVNGRLPCPARSSGGGAEVNDGAGNCTSGGVDDYYGGTLAGGVVGGLLPASTVGYQQVDPGGFAIDAWGNRLRYAVAKNNTGCTTTPPANTRLFTNAGNLKTYGVACQPNDLIICKSSTGITATACGGGANQIMSQSLVVAIVFSTGKNGSLFAAGAGLDEQANLNGDPVFVFHPRTDSSFANGEFDDQMTWITVGELYGRLIGAGVLP